MSNDAQAPFPNGGEIIPRQIMQFRVGKHLPNKDLSNLPAKLLPFQKLGKSDTVRTRNLLLTEYDDKAGVPIIGLLNDSHWDDPVTEKPVLDTIEIWNFLNLTDDAHPIHSHLVHFQILERQPFDVAQYLAARKLVFRWPAEPPAVNEVGWKHTVLAGPRVITRVIAKFEGYTGRYVWQCHILEHEDNQMMRPYEVVRRAD
jgi:spore coat protein A